MEPKDATKHAETTGDDFGFTPREKRSIFTKKTGDLSPVWEFLFGVSLIDRTNLGNASIAGRELSITVKESTNP